MQFFINQDTPTSIETIVVGVPDHLNQLGEIKYHKTLIKERLETLKQYHVINSSIGKISSTLIYIDEKPKRLLTVGLGNLKILSYQRLLKVWGQLFQYLKDVHVTDCEL
ncbi:MAG: M17 family peptidase N-terminal domain-containing protein, partial [Staphylococcus epidermidis]|nr:M17 family peptidase N-terminal domain-containing protein [Staphylococcus epidermidis]